MKNLNLIKLAFVALLGVVIFQSCSKDETIVPVSDKPSYTVRPDFATLDTRPAEVIAQHQVTGKDTEPAKLIAEGTKAKYALVIGISNYAGTANDLQYCDDDAIDWKNRLVTEGYSVTSLIDLAATNSAIQSALTTLASRSIAGNEIAFVYSGHGSNGSIISTDMYYISSSYFQTKFTNATSTKMYFTFDACQIGAMKTALIKTGRIVSVASNTTLYSYDGDATMKNGVYTYYQMKGYDTQGYIYVENDCSYANTQMIAWANARGLSVAPSYSDSYTGSLNL